MNNWLRQLKRGKKYDLSYILSGANPAASLDERIVWLEQLVDWLRSDDESQSKSVRVRFLMQLLDRNPEWKQKTAELICSILSHTVMVRLFTETGVPSWTSINQEFFSRLVKVFLHGSAEGSSSLKAILEQVFYEEQDAEWLSQISDALQNEVFQWLLLGAGKFPELREKVRLELLNAMLILTMKSAAITVRADFAMRAPDYEDLFQHPLLRLELHLLSLRKAFDRPIDDPELPTILQLTKDSIDQELNETRDISTFVKNHLEEHGVSVDLVYQRDRLKLYVERMRYLSATLFAVMEKPAAHEQTFFILFINLVRGSNYDRDFSYLVKKNLSLISKKIVDFTGNAGEGYIAQNRSDYMHLFWYAAGGGFLTAFTVLFKYAVSQEGWPMAIELFYSFLNYSGSFVLMHFLHFKLATKQPSMTAAALASKLKVSGNATDDDVFVDEIAKITRSQFASVLGNIFAVIPAAYLLDLVWTAVHGNHYLDAAHANHMLETIHPWHTLTILYAAMTGVLLWFSGITAGWLENAAVYYRVPEIIRNHKILKTVLGEERTRKISGAFLRNISGIAGSVSLGFYLAAWPILGKFFGLPLDIRHVTLTTGAVTMAVQSLGASSLTGMQWLTLGLGIAMIGMMNFSISFILATMVAVRAKEVSARRTLSIFHKAFRQWLRSPIRFMFPT